MRGRVVKRLIDVRRVAESVLGGNRGWREVDARAPKVVDRRPDPERVFWSDGSLTLRRGTSTSIAPLWGRG
jgi:hypothetical protein